MTTISLCSGTGMFDLGVSLAGFNIIAQVEIDEYCRRVLKRHAPSYWPNAKQYNDVKEFGGKQINGAVDLIFGGFPCQPYSVAGSQKGEDDSRNLWPQFKRVIGEIRPRAVMLENVLGITQAYTLEGELRPAYALTVIADLTELGYDAQWGIISAADCGAPHNRKRWWCVAYANGERRQEPQRRKPAQRRRPIKRHKTVGKPQVQRLPLRQQTGRLPDKAQARKRLGINRSQRPIKRFTQSRMGRATHGIAGRLDGLRWPARPNVHQYEWEAPRTVEPRTVENRVQRIKALGNGGIWTIAYVLACGIRENLMEASA